MDFLDLVKKRISVRDYIDKSVGRELVEKCLESARLAPSACNSQPWSFIVIDNKEKIREIVKESCSGIYSMNKFIENAPVLIVFITEKSKIAARLGGQIRDMAYNLIDIGIVGEHIALQATELGLGTCWIGWFNDKALKKVLNLKENTQIDIVMSLGYPDESKNRIKPRKEIDEIREYWE